MGTRSLGAPTWLGGDDTLLGVPHVARTRPRRLAAMGLWHDTLLGVPHVARTTGVAFPFVLERLSRARS